MRGILGLIYFRCLTQLLLTQTSTLIHLVFSQETLFEHLTLHTDLSFDPSSHFDILQPCEEPLTTPLNHLEINLPPVRRNRLRTRQPPPKLLDYVTYAARHPITDCLAYHHCSLSHATFLCSLSNHYEPRTFQEANLLSEWKLCTKSYMH